MSELHHLQYCDGQIRNAQVVFQALQEKMKVLQRDLSKKDRKIVVSISGGSGVGKTGIATMVADYFKENGIGSCVISGDDYPHRIPKYNDAERLEVYRRHGYSGLERYLGTPKEIDFAEINTLLNDFKKNESFIYRKHIGMNEYDLYYEKVDVSHVKVLILEWTHGNSDYLTGVDIPVYLHSTPKETEEYRRKRNRGEEEIDTPFIQMVLEIEQDKLYSQVKVGQIILSKEGKLLDYYSFSEMSKNRNI